MTSPPQGAHTRYLHPETRLGREAPQGAIAQLGEHLLCKQGVVGSIPTGSTNPVSMSVRETTHASLAVHQWFRVRTKVRRLFFKNSEVVLTHQIQAKSMNRGA